MDDLFHFLDHLINLGFSVLGLAWAIFGSGPHYISGVFVQFTVRLFCPFLLFLPDAHWRVEASKKEPRLQRPYESAQRQG